jgi:hypothetical protein
MRYFPKLLEFDNKGVVYEYIFHDFNERYSSQFEYSILRRSKTSQWHPHRNPLNRHHPTPLRE